MDEGAPTARALQTSQLERPLTVQSLDKLIRFEFPLAPNLTYLNHAAVGPWPRRTADAVRAFAADNSAFGARDYPVWLQREQALQALAAQLINAHADDIALMKNTSEALSVVAQGLAWAHGDEIVIAAHEFPSNRLPWEALRSRGVRVIEVELSATAPEDALLAACTPRTRVLAASSVHYASGLRLDLVRLGTGCRTRGIAFCVDAIQGLGVFPHDVGAMHIDFLMADGHKWLLAPEGLALFYCAPQWRGKLQLHQHGWHMTEHPHDFTRRDWAPAASARRFEPGSPNMLGIHALAASLTLLLEVGIDVIDARVRERAECLFNAIRRAPMLQLITEPVDGRYGGIVTFCHRTQPAEGLHAKLTAAGVVCALRGGGIRFSPHFYNDLSQLEQAVAVIAD